MINQNFWLLNYRAQPKMVVQFKGKTQILFFILPPIKIIFISFFTLFLSFSSKSHLSFSTLIDTSLAPIPPSSSPKLTQALSSINHLHSFSLTHLSPSRHLAQNAQDEQSKMRQKKRSQSWCSMAIVFFFFFFFTR